MRFLPLAAVLPALMLACSALAGCTDADWDHAMSYAGLGDARVAADAPAAQPAPIEAVPMQSAPMQSTADIGFCQAVAHQDASDDGFDAATQNRVFQRSFGQCVAMFGDPQARGTIAANSR